MNKPIITRNILLSLTIVTIISILGCSALGPVLDKFDQNRFVTLDTQINGILKNLQSISDSVEPWKYEKYCSEKMSGWMPTGNYSCIASISLEKTINSLYEVNVLHTKYYPVIDSSSILNQKTNLDLQLPSDFGKKFVVSSAEKKYIEIKSGIECRYLISITQNKSNKLTDNSRYGSEIDGAIGSLVISLRCSDAARNYWYPL